MTSIIQFSIVSYYANDEIFFKIPKTNRFGEVFKKYCAIKNYDQNNVIYLHQGRLVIEDDNPNNIFLKDNGKLVCCLLYPSLQRIY